jgi:hypothetical protein
VHFFCFPFALCQEHAELRSHLPFTPLKTMYTNTGESLGVADRKVRIVFPKSRTTILPKLVTVVHTSRYTILTLFFTKKETGKVQVEFQLGRRFRRRQRRGGRYGLLSSYPNYRRLVSCTVWSTGPDPFPIPDIHAIRNTDTARFT